jgi:hypothetical protein
MPGKSPSFGDAFTFVIYNLRNVDLDCVCVLPASVNSSDTTHCAAPPNSDFLWCSLLPIHFILSDFSLLGFNLADLKKIVQGRDLQP